MLFVAGSRRKRDVFLLKNENERVGLRKGGNRKRGDEEERMKGKEWVIPLY